MGFILGTGGEGVLESLKSLYSVFNKTACGKYVFDFIYSFLCYAISSYYYFSFFLPSLIVLFYLAVSKGFYL
jgi:hypothetical protein